MTNKFYQKLELGWGQNKFVCVGLDPDLSKIPQEFKDKYTSTGDLFLEFNKSIIDSTQDLVLAYKPNAAFYEAHGEGGLKSLKKTIKYIHQVAPNVSVILDAKRADIGNTNEGYVMSAFDDLDADAITVHPYLGQEALRPFLDRTDKGIIVLVKTSNPGSGEIQDLTLEDGIPLYLRLAENISDNWNEKGNVGIVVGATYPDELKKIREVVGDMPILIPGIGVQGGDVEKTLRAENIGRCLINSSRGVIYSDNPRKAAEDLNKEINSYRNN